MKQAESSFGRLLKARKCIQQRTELREAKAFSNVIRICESSEMRDGTNIQFESLFLTQFQVGLYGSETGRVETAGTDGSAQGI